MKKPLVWLAVSVWVSAVSGANDWTGGSDADMSLLSNWNNQGLSATAVKNQIRAFRAPVSGVWLGTNFTVNALYNYAAGTVSLDLERESGGEERKLTLVGRTSSGTPYFLAYTADSTGANESTMEFLSGTISCETNIYIAAKSDNLANKALRVSGTAGRHATLDMNGHWIGFGDRSGIRGSRLEILNGAVVTNALIGGTWDNGWECGHGTVVVDSSRLFLTRRDSYIRSVNNRVILQGTSPELRSFTSGLEIGRGGTSTNNLLAVRASGTVDLSDGSVYVGTSGGHDNRFEVSGSGATVKMTSLRVGSGGPSNGAVLTGENQTINLSGVLTVGYGNSAVSNRLETALTNSTLTCDKLYVGYLTNAFNRAVIAGSNLTVTVSNTEFSIGEYGSTNELVVSGPEVVMRTSLFRPGRRDTADANTVVVRDGAAVIVTDSRYDAQIGVNGTRTRVRIDGGTLETHSTRAIVIGDSPAARDSTLEICGGGAVRAKYLRAGMNGGLDSTLVVSNGLVEVEHVTFPQTGNSTTGHSILLAGTNSQIKTTGNVGIRCDTTVRFAPEPGCERKPYFEIAGKLIIEADARIEVDPAAVARYARAGAGTMTLFAWGGTYTVPQAKIDACNAELAAAVPDIPARVSVRGKSIVLRIPRRGLSVIIR